MQQLTLTLIALLCVLAPSANSRIASFFGRFVPPMASGRVLAAASIAAETGRLTGEPQGCAIYNGEIAPQQTTVIEALLICMKRVDSTRNGAARFALS